MRKRTKGKEGKTKFTKGYSLMGVGIKVGSVGSASRASRASRACLSGHQLLALVDAYNYFLLLLTGLTGRKPDALQEFIVPWIRTEAIGHGFDLEAS